MEEWKMITVYHTYRMNKVRILQTILPMPVSVCLICVFMSFYLPTCLARTFYVDMPTLFRAYLPLSNGPTGGQTDAADTSTTASSHQSSRVCNLPHRPGIYGACAELEPSSTASPPAAPPHRSSAPSPSSSVSDLTPPPPTTHR